MSILSITGSVIVSLNDNTTDFTPTLAIDQRMSIARWALIPIELTSDAEFVVGLNGMSPIHAITIVSDGKVTVELTSADGTDQKIPVDPFATIVSASAPFTAIKLTRVAGSANSIKLFLAQAA